MSPRSTLLALLLPLLPLAAAAQSSGPEQYLIKSCTEPKVPFGQLPPAKGVIRFTLKKDGRADTASVGVLQVVAASVAGFRSIAIRQLSACRFEMGSAKADVTVTEDVIVTAGTVALHPAIPAPSSTEPPLPLESASIAPDTFPLPLDDPRLEERPRRLRCENPPMPLVPRAQIESAMAQWKQVWGGTIHANVRVDAKGEPNRRVQVLSSTNERATRNLIDLILGCTYAPGRYRGVAVPALVRDSIGVVTDRKSGS